MVVLAVVCGMNQGICTHRELRKRQKSHSLLDPSNRYFILLAQTNVNVDGRVMCMHTQAQKPSKVKCNHSTTVPGKPSNDRLTVPAQNGMARNSVLQSYCPERCKEKHDVHLERRTS